ncbi:hypothetical protein RFZ03_16995, partial [Acinetobacter baumannii]|nr:hypothetical protein [Acinetobacter baumannii]
LTDKSKDMIQSVDDLRSMYPDQMVLAMIPDMRSSNKKNSYYAAYYGEAEKKKNGGKQNG